MMPGASFGFSDTTFNQLLRHPCSYFIAHNFLLLREPYIITPVYIRIALIRVYYHLGDTAG